MTPVFEMALRTGSWGAQAYMLSFHAKVTVELAPRDRPDVVVRLVDGLPAVPRELTKGDIKELSVCDESGRPRLIIRPDSGWVERATGSTPTGPWELRIEGQGQHSLQLYARRDVPFPSETDLDALAALVDVPVT